MQPIVVYDTNILLSSIGWGGNPYRCLELARQSKIEGLTCPEILGELAEKLTTKLNFSPSQITDTVADLLGFLRLVRITNTLKVIAADSDDDKVISKHKGKFLVIDIETGEYEINTDDLVATKQLLAKYPNAVIYGLRIGYPTAYRIRL